METHTLSPESIGDNIAQRTAKPPAQIDVGLLTGGQDRPYAYGLAMALISKGVNLDVVGSDEVDSPELQTTPKLNFLNLRGNQRRDASLPRKVSRVLTYYARLIRYATIAKPKIFHILWNNKFEFFDRTLLMLFYKVYGRKVVLTAHNVNAGKRDSKDSPLNRLTLKIQYRLADHIFVHTEKMKTELVEKFGVRALAITVLTHPINDAFPDTDLTPTEAKRRLGITHGEKTLLFFGIIRPYKGLEYLVEAFQRLATTHPDYRLIIAGRPVQEGVRYLEEIQRRMSRDVDAGRIIQKIQFIPDGEMELYLKAADVLVLPYKEIFQSGVLFLAYSFGLPVIAADVGSFREAIIEGQTGFVCKPCDPVDLAGVIETYFKSDLFTTLDRQKIKNYAHAQHSWEPVAEMTRNAYAGLLGR